MNEPTYAEVTRLIAAHKEDSRALRQAIKGITERDELNRDLRAYIAALMVKHEREIKASEREIKALHLRLEEVEKQ